MKIEYFCPQCDGTNVSHMCEWDKETQRWEIAWGHDRVCYDCSEDETVDGDFGRREIKEEGIPNENVVNWCKCNTECNGEISPTERQDPHYTNSTKIHLELPNEYIESAKKISERVMSFYKEKGAVPEPTITPLLVLETALDHRETNKYPPREYTELEDGTIDYDSTISAHPDDYGEGVVVDCHFDYDDIFDNPDKIFKYFVYNYQHEKSLDKTIAEMDKQSTEHNSTEEGVHKAPGSHWGRLLNKMIEEGGGRE
jgi:hypothetical protein